MSSLPSTSVQQTRRQTQRHWLVLQIAWLVVTGLSVVLFLRNIPATYAQLQTLCTDPACVNGLGRLTPTSAQALTEIGISIRSYATYTVVFGIGAAFVYWTVAVLIVWRKPNEYMALLVSLLLVLMGATPPTTDAVAAQEWWLVIRLVQYASSILLVLVFYTFPNGQFVPRWTRWAALVFVISEVFYHFQPVLPIGLTRIALTLDNMIWPASLLGIAIAQVYRYRYVSTPRQRQQTKWVVFGLVVGVVGIIAFLTPGWLTFSLKLRVPTVLNAAYTLSAYTVISALLLLVPLSFGIAILRRQLWDIDVLINRTLVYGVLTAALACIYVGLVLGFQYVVPVVIGQSRSQWATVGSTLAIVALFQPLRRRIQDLIDRRFYRRKYDAQKTLQAFSTRLREETDLNTLRSDLLAVAQDTLQPAHVSMWLVEPEQRKA